jgi:hypothetical protein
MQKEYDFTDAEQYKVYRHIEELEISNNDLTYKLYLALEEVARLERGEKIATNARDFLDELKGLVNEG